MYTRSQEFKLAFKNKLHENTDQYWKEYFEKDRADTIYDWESSGILEKVKQVGEVPEQDFNLDKYLT